jgi:hypothetical protein
MRDEETHIKATDRGSGVQLVSELSDLAAAGGIVTFPLAPLALPAPARTALLAIPLLLATLVGVLAAVPIVGAARGVRRSSTRSHAADTPARRAVLAPTLGGRSQVTRTAGGVS